MNTALRHRFGVAGLYYALFAIVLTGCSSRLPNDEGFVIHYTLQTEASTEYAPESGSVLEVSWLGTSSFQLRFGDTAVLTDPFFSHQTQRWQSLFGMLETDQQMLERQARRLEKPDVIFIGHAHYDHLMDAVPLLRHKDWRQVEIVGSTTAINLLSGYDNDKDWSLRKVQPQPEFQIASNQAIRFLTIKGEHMPQVGGILFYDKPVLTPRETPPKRAHDFQVGEVLAYLIELEHDGRTVSVFFTSTASPLPEAAVKLLSQYAPVDLAILSVPSWKKASGYPNDIVLALQPRYIIPSHFNDFLSDYDQRKLLPNAQFNSFLMELQHAAKQYKGFRSLIVPDLGAPIVIPVATGDMLP